MLPMVARLHSTVYEPDNHVAEASLTNILGCVMPFMMPLPDAREFAAARQQDS
jgi:hypothetical protein